MSKGRGSIPRAILMERIRQVVADHKQRAKSSGSSSRKKVSRKTA